MMKHANVNVADLAADNQPELLELLAEVWPKAEAKLPDRYCYVWDDAKQEWDECDFLHVAYAELEAGKVTMVAEFQIVNGVPVAILSFME